MDSEVQVTLELSIEQHLDNRHPRSVGNIMKVAFLCTVPLYFRCVSRVQLGA